MPLAPQFSLSLELASILPIKSALSYTASTVVSLARELKRSGSDLLVEEDLAAIFGRGKIVPSVENHFKDVVKIASIESLHPGSEIILDAGPGATVRRALKDRYYMATVLQLSFLGSMHETTRLASVLVECMNKRFDQGVEGATPDPDYDGILATLQACLSQTSQFSWDMMRELVESKFENSRSWLELQQSPLKRLSTNTLLAVMDYLYLVQSLPENRLIMIDNQMGVVPIIIWAHCILGLRVLVQNSPDGDISWGSAGNPQVIIRWSKDWLLFEDELVAQPTVFLLDGDMNVVLKEIPDENEVVKLEGEERHRLEGYGTLFLRRLLNRFSIVVEDHAVYQETAQFAVAFAIVVSRVMRRIPFQHEEGSTVPRQCYQHTEIWQIKESSQVLFDGIPLDWGAIAGYGEEGITAEDGSWRIPPAARTYLENIKRMDKHIYNKGALISDIKRMASWILAFAQVVDVKSCGQMPLIVDPENLYCPGIMVWSGKDPIDMSSKIWFSRIIVMLIGQTTGRVLVGSGNRLVLVSERGWSLFFSNLGDNDPGTVNCASLSIKRGVPTNTRTQERRYQISDAPRISPPAPPKGPAPVPWVIEKSGSYIPRCFTPVTKRIEHYSSRSKDFWLSIRYDVEEVWPEGVKRYSLYASPRQFHEALWGVVKTEPCEHPENDERQELDLGVVTVKGLHWTLESGTENKRICVCLVKGDSRARWLVIAGIITDLGKDENVPEGLERQVMLRCAGCCVGCAVKSASSMKGKWLVIL
ncbi:hypothetical protein V8E51_002388 [Hyaloscypha variabilis]